MIDSVFFTFLIRERCPHLSINRDKIRLYLAKVGLTLDDIIGEKSRFKSYLDVANIPVQRNFHEVMDGIPKEMICEGAALRFGAETFKPDNQNWLCCF